MFVDLMSHVERSMHEAALLRARRADLLRAAEELRECVARELDA